MNKTINAALARRKKTPPPKPPLTYRLDLPPGTAMNHWNMAPPGMPMVLANMLIYPTADGERVAAALEKAARDVRMQAKAVLDAEAAVARAALAAAEKAGEEGGENGESEDGVAE